jgi:tetratricopeptide (TPR) repeat protein
MDIKRLSSSKPAALAIILAVSFGVYFNALFNGFVYDDRYLILQNPWIRDARHIPDIFLTNIWAFQGEGASSYYRPILHLIYMVDYHIFGLRPWGFHLSKILFHAGNSLLVFFTASTIINRHMGGDTDTKTPQVYIPFVAALLFAIHPIHTEAVTVGTTEVSLAFFYLLSFYLYIRADVMGRGVPVSSLVFFFLAVLSKETALTLPILLFAYDYSFKRGLILRLTSNTLYLLLKKYLPYLVVAGIYFVMRTHAIGGFAPVKFHTDLSNYEYFINVFPLFAQYLGKLILPINLNAAYVFHPMHSLIEWKGILAVAVTLCFIFTLYLVRDRNRVAFFSLLWIVIPLLPVFYIPALGEHTFAERYLYLPSVGFVIIVSVGLCGIARLDVLSSRALTLMLSVVLVITALYSAGTVKRNPIWKDDLTLWSDTVRKSPDSHEAHINLGLAYDGQGRVDEAIEEFRFALRLNPGNEIAHYNLGNAYHNLGLIDEAIGEFKEAIRLKHYFVNAHDNLGKAYAAQGRMDEAIEEFKEAIRLKPGFANAHNNLGNAYAAQGRMDEAIEEFKEAIRLKPGFANAHNNLGNAYAMKWRLDGAIEEYKKAIRLKSDYFDAHFNLGLAYKQKGLKNEAIRELEECLRIRPGDSVVRKILESLSRQ